MCYQTLTRVGNIVELSNGEHREVIGLVDSGVILDDNTSVPVSDIARILSDEEIADMLMDRFSDL